MGLLSFRKKSKKNAVKESVSSDMESVTSSPIVQSLLTDTSDISSNNLLHGIFNDLPITSTTSFSSGSEASSKDIRHSLNLKSNYGGNANNISPFSHAPPPTTTPPMIRGRISTSSDESSIDSFSSTDDATVPPPSLNTADTNKAEDTTPLIELISRSYTASSRTANSIKRTLVHNGPPAIQRSPGFAIDRMKERHRQEYHKSKQTSLPPPVNHQGFVVRNMASVVNQDNRTFRNATISSPSSFSANPLYRPYPVMSGTPEPQTVKYFNNEGPTKHVTPSHIKIDNITPLTKNNRHQVCYTQPTVVVHTSHFSGKGAIIKQPTKIKQVDSAEKMRDTTTRSSNRRKYQSVPNLLHLLDNHDEAKRIVDENHQHFNNKFIYRYSYPHQCQHRRKPEPRCSCQQRRRGEKKQWKPLLKITPFEDQTGFSITEAQQQQATKVDKLRLKTQNKRHHPDYVSAQN